MRNEKGFIRRKRELHIPSEIEAVTLTAHRSDHFLCMLCLNLFAQTPHQYIDGMAFAQFSIGIELQH